ncbi:MAG: MBL fold metallo-hydrolase, partial [Sphingomonadaceae bacterium]|nr:MBL fold metallo-hydrolase [Sphingomonadaceae bacterium]
IGHRRQRENQIVRLLGEGAKAIEQMVPLMYKGLDPRLTGAAGMSVKAHLLDLERRGLVNRSGDIWQTI